MSDERLLIIVEDDEGFARTLKRSFERRDYTVLHADGFETLTDVLGDKIPGYAVVDLKLGGASGLACVEALHALRGGSERLVVWLAVPSSKTTDETAGPHLQFADNAGGEEESTFNDDDGMIKAIATDLKGQRWDTDKATWK